MKLGSKLVAQTVLPAIVAITVLLVIVTHVADDALQNAAEGSLIAVAEARREDLRGYFNRMQDDILTMGSAPAVTKALRELTNAYGACGKDAATQLQHFYDNAHHTANKIVTPSDARLDNKSCIETYQKAHTDADPFFRKRHISYGWSDMLLVDPKGNVIYSILKEKDFTSNLLTGPWKASGLARIANISLNQSVSGVPAFADAERYLPSGGKPGMFLSVPVFEPDSGQLLGVLAARIAFEPLNQRMHFKAGLGDTGESFLVGTGGWLLTNTFFNKEYSTYNRQLKTEAVKRVLAGEEGNEELVDYRGIESFIAYRSLQPFSGALGDQPRWGVIAKISREEALASLRAIQWLIVSSGLLIALVAMAYGIITARRLFNPILAIKDALTRLAKGEKTPIPGLDRHDELGAMAKAAETFRAMSEAVARDRWIREHVATLTTEVSRESRITRVPDIVLTLLRQQFDIPVASLFLRDNAGNYRRVGAQGLARRSQAEDCFALGETLIGQCARDAQPVILSPVPHGLTLIATGLAEFPPHELILYPIISKGETLAVVELASVRKLSPEDHAFLAALVEPLGLHLANINATERNLALLEESRAQAETLTLQKTELGQKNVEMQALADEMRGQSEELKAQNEEFRANQEELRAQQEELAHKNQALESQGRQLEHGREEAETRARELAQSNVYKSQFLANMSHELRTPLNSILILAKHLADNSAQHLDPDEVESASVIHESGSQLLSLINDILDLSKIEAGKLEMLEEDFPVSEMLLYLHRLFEPLAEKKSIGFSINSEAAGIETIRSDRRHLTQVLTNLLSNAIKFTDHGTVCLEVQGNAKELIFNVIDSGIGIVTDKIEHIFGAFQQLDGGTARKYGGSGLGLAISRQLVELLGGRIEVDSTPGSGSRFSVHLPRNTPFDKITASAPESTSLPPHSSPAKRGTLILMVEDDARLLPIVTRLIETLGYAVRAVDSGEKALELIANERPAGILLDLGLPGISGMEVLRRIKSDPASASIPVYIMSGAADTGEAKTLGASGYIRKPISRDAVLAAIRHMLSAEPSTPPPQPPAPRSKLARVLLVDDDDASTLAVRTLFKGQPVEIILAGTGEAGLTALKEANFDAVILDLTLPDMNGFEWLERLTNALPEHPPVIVYSARDLDDNELLRLNVHAESVVSKGRHNGFTSTRLRDEVLHTLNGQQNNKRAETRPKKKTRHGNLLIVDDDVRNQSALSKVLRAHGFTVTVATSGAQALEIAADTAFDAILTDIMMPEMDGFELIRRLRDTSPKMPIIAVTAKAMAGDIELCISAGATDYLAKPVDIERLLEQLEQWL